MAIGNGLARHCVDCGQKMILVKCGPAFVNDKTKIYKCSETKCNHTEKVTILAHSFLMVCSNATPGLPDSVA